ncbi:MAG: ammonia-forming cytochrome c nitrite reductase subunit c552 [Bacteroidetes bacterium GWA2_31_9b]|nr:MAG: ammonia-forming cytochrome c nitrite reductase subunit c552 [Bacteroidetes bacterium GWA2_31_9b]
MKPISDQIKEKPWLGWAIFFSTIIVVFFLGLLALSIIERRTEAVFAYTPKVEYTQWEPRNEVWGQNFPRQYNRYMQTADTSFASKYNGGAMRDMLAEDPRLVVLWAGYAFSKEYSQGRGHYYAINDIQNILRTGAPMEGQKSPQPSTCWTCKSPDVPRVMQEVGIAEFYKGSWDTRGAEIMNFIGCADCHDAQNMNLRITRPALVEAYDRRGLDINKVSHQDMRSLVCAQCHVEYYFQGEDKYLVFPWDKGFTVEDVEEYYDSYTFKDWTHAISKTPMLKAQHPDFEIFNSGIHAQRGLSCADCHMPYMNEGGQKFTDHKIQSPLNNVANTCQVCHREETPKLIANVYERQDKIKQNRDKLEELLVRAHVEAGKAWELGAKEIEMQAILQDIRHAQWRWDFIAASHGGSFHSPIECSRIISTGIDIAQESRIKLARLLASYGYNKEVPYPDIDTKEKAQKYIGLDMQKLNADKEKFIKEVIPQWKKQAEEREKTYAIKNL